MLKTWVRWVSLSAGILLIGCSQTKVLRVDMHHLRDIDTSRNVSRDLGTAEKKYLLHGKVTHAERIEQLGHYYTVSWSADPDAGPVEISLKYRQAKTGAKVLTQAVSREATSGSTRIEVKGDAYARNGRIISWKIELKQSGKILAEEQSYLWE